jgi:hypothetical protein
VSPKDKNRDELVVGDIVTIRGRVIKADSDFYIEIAIEAENGRMEDTQLMLPAHMVQKLSQDLNRVG